MNNLKNEKRITLRVLILIIIAMVILVSVAISVVVKRNLIGKRQETVEKHKTETQKENSLENKNLTTESYIGKYAYVDGKYGIIFVDLAVPSSGEWGYHSEHYSYPGEKDATSGFKSYYIMEGEKKTDDFGTADVIIADETKTGNDRFYVMALDDVNADERYYWYNNAIDYEIWRETGIGKMDDYETTTSINFGEGKTNTENMLTKWNTEAYGTKMTTKGGLYNRIDMWSVIPTGSKWFVPSSAEWAAFAGNLNINKDNYGDYGLSQDYWSSSQKNDCYVWAATFDASYRNLRQRHFFRLLCALMHDILIYIFFISIKLICQNRVL